MLSLCLLMLLAGYGTCTAASVPMCSEVMELALLVLVSTLCFLLASTTSCLRYAGVGQSSLEFFSSGLLAGCLHHASVGGV